MFNIENETNNQTSENNVEQGTYNAQENFLLDNKPNIVKLSWWKHLTIFLAGWLGLQIIATVISFLYGFVYENNAFASMSVNFWAYAISVIGLLAILWPDYKKLLPSFRKWLPYLMGLAGLAALYTFNLLYNTFIQVIHPISNNANQEAIDSLMIQYPALSIIMVCLLAPICEELTYRVGLFSLLSKVHISLAYIGSALIFALIHFDWFSFGNTEQLINELLNLPTYIFAGLTFGFLYHKFGLAASLSAHFNNNLLSCIIILALSHLG